MARRKLVRDPNAPQHCRKCNVLLTRGDNIAPSKYDRFDSICRDCARKEREELNRDLDDLLDDMRRTYAHLKVRQRTDAVRRKRRRQCAKQ